MIMCTSIWEIKR